MTPSAGTPKRFVVPGFELVGELGRGAMGVVYRARDVAAGRDVALKVLLGDGARGQQHERLRREAELTASLQHPGIVAVHGAGEANGVPYIVYELVEGARTLTVASSELGLSARCRLVRDAAQALGHAHAEGVLHRDVKPENMLVDSQGRVRVTDFGIASAVGLERLTQTGALAGTPVYMAPEQIAGHRDEYCPATDVWALGVTLYECLTDTRPFDGVNVLELFAQIAAAKPLPPRSLNPETSAALEEVCLRALSSRPQDRYSDGTSFAEALDAALAGHRPGRKRGRRVGLGVACCAAIVAVGLLSATRPAAAPALPPPQDAPPVDLPAVKPQTAVPAWFAELRRRERPALPLPPGWTFGEGVGEYVSSRPSRTVMVFVPSGAVPLGTPYVGTQGEVEHGFFLGKTEVSRGEYRRFCEVRALELPSLHLEQLAFAEDDDSLPVFSVGFDDALAYCEWAELRLPTYVEWELAARGAGGRTYPWGEGTPRRDLANFDYEDGTPLRPHAVTSLPKGAAPCGALNMVGNVYEIVRGFPRGATHQKEPLVGADEPVDGMIVRGGSFHTHNSRNQTGWAGKMVDRNGTSKAGFRVAGPR